MNYRMKSLFLVCLPIQGKKHIFFFSGLTTKVIPPPPLDLSGSYFFCKFFPLMNFFCLVVMGFSSLVMPILEKDTYIS